MAVDAVCLLGLGTSTSVLEECHGFEMSRVGTITNTAEMIDLEAGGDLADEYAVDDDVNVEDAAERRRNPRSPISVMGMRTGESPARRLQRPWVFLEAEEGPGAGGKLGGAHAGGRASTRGFQMPPRLLRGLRATKPPAASSWSAR
jgi:hypothetical protein